MVKYRLEERHHVGWRMSPIRDLSTVGVRFISEEEFAVGAVLDLQLGLPSAGRPVAVKGQVVWRRRRGEGPMAEVGVAFPELDDATRRQLDQAIEFFFRKHRGSHGQ